MYETQYTASHTQMHEVQLKLYGALYLFNYQGNGDRVTIGINSPPLVGQQVRVKELTSGRATHCPEVEKLYSKVEN